MRTGAVTRAGGGHEARIGGRTGTQELINPKKLCRRFRCVSGVGTYLGNMPECVLTPGDDVPSIPYLQNSVFTL